MSQQQPRPEDESTQPRGAEDSSSTANTTDSLPDKTKGLDFGKLDLTIERVDERLSPSETNIFDK